MPPKRKAASPNVPPVSRARSAKAAKASPATDGNDQESDFLAPRPAKRARRAPSRAAKLGEDLDDDFEYGGSRASKPATVEQHLMEQSKKSKEFIQGFKEQVTRGRDRVHETLEKYKQDLLNSHESQKTDLEDIYTILRTAAQTLDTKDNPLFAQTQQLLRLSRAILKCHHAAERDARPRLEQLASPRETWKQDEEGMRKLLQHGRLYGEKIAERVINPEGGQEEEEEESSGSDKENRGETEDLARGLFEKSRKGLERKEETWGVAARRQMVALAGLVRTLPARERTK
ncbi:hypothetical protein VTK56DRAFT_10054 [Thermocarpiscus australiensis]